MKAKTMRVPLHSEGAGAQCHHQEPEHEQDRSDQKASDAIHMHSHICAGRRRKRVLELRLSANVRFDTRPAFLLAQIGQGFQ